MTNVIEAHGLTQRFGAFTALDEVSFSVEQNTICGLLGRNGAGKTTIMQLLTGLQFPHSGSVDVFGRTPAENAAVLSQVCFVRESQKYPEDFTATHALRSAKWFFPQWDEKLAERLVADFRLPMKRRIKKLSRGQLSAVGIVVGLASRAPLTLFDEPYLGLDAVARQLFYDRLLEDYAENPRTVILSTHLIDEVGALLEKVVLVDAGRVVLEEDAETLRGAMTVVSGTASAVDAFAATRRVLHRESLGGFAAITVDRLDAASRAQAQAAGLELAPVSLQQLIIRTTTSTEETVS
jgi:ABC-2 type transport system ATP-binding protein